MPRKLTAARNASSTLPAPLTPDPAANPPPLLATTFAPGFAPPPAAVAPSAVRRQRILLRARIGGCFVSHLGYVYLYSLLLLLLLLSRCFFVAVRLFLFLIRVSSAQVACHGPQHRTHMHICYLTCFVLLALLFNYILNAFTELCCLHLHITRHSLRT